MATVRLAFGLLAFVAAEIYFVRFFEASRWQPTVDLAWLAAVICLSVALWRADPSSLPRLRQPWWFYALYVAALVPFGTNWRWALAGDNLSWPMLALSVKQFGLHQSILSGNGPDNFAALPAHIQNVLMYAIEPNIFWHRFGKILIALCALAAIYTVFARLVRPAFGLLVAGCSATCSVWIVYSYSSGMFINGLASCFTILAVGLWVRRDLDSRPAWLTLGLLSGFMLFLPPTGWVLAASLWIWLGILICLQRRSLWNPILGVVVAVVVATPILWQWAKGTGGLVFTLVQNPNWTVDKVVRFLQEAAYFPFASQLQDSGAFGPQLPWGFRWLFIPGVLIAPLFPKRFPGSRFVLALLLLHIVSLAFAQGPYGGVSVKRALVLIPMATYFVFILFHPFLKSLLVVLPIMALWAAFGVNDIVNNIIPGRTGYTLLDGAIEAHQRFAPSTVCMYLVNDGRAQSLRAGSDLDHLYHLAPRMQVVTDANDPACSKVLCYCSQTQCQQVDLKALGYTEQPMQNTVEMRCGVRQMPGGAAPVGSS